MPGEPQDISLPAIAAQVEKNTAAIADLSPRLQKLESDNSGFEVHLREQDQKLGALPKIELAIIGDGGDANIGLVRKMDEVKHDVKSLKSRDVKWSNGFWYVVGAFITAIFGGIAFAVATYLIHPK